MSPRVRRRSPLVPAVELQLIALAMLAVILLPVISLTDDLQAKITPAESEHFSRRGDVQPATNPFLHRPPAALAPPVARPGVPPFAMPGFVGVQHAAARRASELSRAIAIRPPPEWPC